MLSGYFSLFDTVNIVVPSNGTWSRGHQYKNTINWRITKVHKPFVKEWVKVSDIQCNNYSSIHYIYSFVVVRMTWHERHTNLRRAHQKKKLNSNSFFLFCLYIISSKCRMNYKNPATFIFACESAIAQWVDAPILLGNAEMLWTGVFILPNGRTEGSSRLLYDRC